MFMATMIMQFRLEHRIFWGHFVNTQDADEKSPLNSGIILRKVFQVNEIGKRILRGKKAKAKKYIKQKKFKKALLDQKSLFMM